MNKVFIAGGTGMLGSAIARDFADTGVEVFASSRKDQDATGDLLASYSDLIKVVKIDLLDTEALKKLFSQEQFDGVVFTAQSHQSAATRSASNEIYPILLNCLETARANKVKRFVFGSSVAVYVGNPEEPQNEQFRFPPRVAEMAPAKFEVAVKRAMEIIALDYGQPFDMGMSVAEPTAKAEPHELEVVVLRSPMMFGPGHGYWATGHPLAIAAHFAAGRIDSFVGHSGLMNMPMKDLWALMVTGPCAYVKDAAECFRVVMTATEIKNPIYNIAGAMPNNARLQLEEFVRAVPDCANRLGLTPEDLPDVTHDSGFNSTLLEQDYGWKPKYTLEATMIDYIAWLKDHPI